MWNTAFNDIKQTLNSWLGDDIITIEHVGSTSVEGLAAKPIIDIDIVIDSMDTFIQVKEKLALHGYVHEGDLGIIGREAFKYIESPFMKHHIYVCPKTSQALKEHRFFKAFLSKHKAFKDEYSKIKLNASKKYPYDIDAYCKEKDPFIKNILRKMEENDEKRLLL
jgi:GrpB-like predicted nucleotidyltransferase (UPF0157 family)